MDSFEDIGVAAELVEALAAEGIERPTPLQEAAIPVLRKGNNLVLAAGPGSGLLVCWCAALLERVGPEGGAPRIVVLTASREAAEHLGESSARLASATGHTVAALGSPWVLPERSHLILGTPSDVLAAVASGALTLAEVRAVVVDQAQHVETLDGLGGVERVIDYLPADSQRVLSALPITPAVADLVVRHFKRALTLPAPDTHGAPSRGKVRFRIVAEPREHAALAIVSELLDDGAKHVLLYSRNDDRAADLGDYLTLHGFVAGAPGDPGVPIWLGVDALEARAAAEGAEGVVVVSCDAPPDPDTLDRRHSISEDGVVVLLPREVPHMKALGRQTGYTTVPFPPPAASARTAADELRGTLERAMETEDTGAYLVALAPLFERHDPAEVAAAAVALLRKKEPSPAATPRAPARAASAAGATPSWAKLFVGVGERDGLRPGDLLGAITGETGIAGDSVGKIEIKESHTLVEVHDAVAQQVIKALNGTTIKGRAVRADFDRPRRGGPPRSGPPRRTGARS